MNIDRELLTSLLEQLISHIGCDECPFYDECENMDSTKDCISFYIQKIQKPLDN